MTDETFFCFYLKEKSTLYLIKGAFIKSIHSMEDCVFNFVPQTGLYVNKFLTLNNTVFPVIEIKKWLDTENEEKPTRVVIISFEDRNYRLEINNIYGIYNLDKTKIFGNNGLRKIDFITYIDEKMVCSLDIKYMLENLYKDKV